MAMVGVVLWQPLQADSQRKSSGLVLGRRPLGAILHSSNEPGELSQWLCHDDSTINIVVLIIIIIIICEIDKQEGMLHMGPGFL